MSSLSTEIEAQEASTSTSSNIKSGYIDYTNIQEKAGSSTFSKAFNNLKKSEFYEEPQAEVKTTGEQKQKVPNKPASKNAVVVNPKQVDVKEPHHELKQLTKICILADLTLMLAWSQEEAGRIIEVYKIYEHKPPDMIMEKQDSNPYSMVIDSLTSVRSINRTDAMTLLSTFGSLEKIIEANEEELSFCPGMGPQKAAKLHRVLHHNFKK